MTNIVSIGTAVPQHRHDQLAILAFMQRVYALDQVEARKLRFLYTQSGISQRYSVLPDYSLSPEEWTFYPPTESLETFPSLEQRMLCYQKEAVLLSTQAVENCLKQARLPLNEVTHLITVSCTGMSAPGLELQLMERLQMPVNLNRSCINFMGCYAALHALKQADAVCQSNPFAKVLIVCTELCTLHFQKTPSIDNMTASMLFGDGAAAVLVSNEATQNGPVKLRNFYGEVFLTGKQDMSWQLSSTGFLMALSGYVPDLIAADFKPMVQRALERYELSWEQVEQWCIHPGGKRILQVIEQTLELPETALTEGYSILDKFGNMSSPSILFVLQEMLQQKRSGITIAAAFGPGLTMETAYLEIS